MMRIYHKPPNSILPELLKPFDQKKGGIINPKILKSRLEILNFAISEYGISDRDAKFNSAVRFLKLIQVNYIFYKTFYRQY